MAKKGTAQDAAGRPNRGSRRRRWVAGVIGVLATVLAVAMAVVTERPEIAVAAGCGVVAAMIVMIIVFGRGRPRWIVLGLTIVGILGALALTSVYLTKSNLPGANADPASTVVYHGEGRVSGEQVALEEQLVLDERIMTAITSGTRTTPPAGAPEPGPPDVQVAGWSPDGLVNGFASFTRTRTVGWDRSTVLADTAVVPLSLGDLTATASGRTYRTNLRPDNGSRLDVVLPKGAVGSAIPAPAARTDALSGGHEETITFDLDRYEFEVSFDVLSAPLRNPAGRALYDASLWGFWEWSVGVVGAVVSGLAIDKLGALLWRPIAALFRRRRPAAPAV
jgi:hypothetical protein